MLKELAEYLFNSGAKSLKATLQPLPNDPEKTLILTPGKPPEIIETPRLPDALTLTVPTLDDFATAWKATESEAAESPIYFNPAGAQFWIDEQNHAVGQVKLTLSPHPLLEQLQALASDGKAFEQRSLLRLLRGEWRDAVIDWREVCGYFSSISWEGKRSSQQTIIQGAATGGGAFSTHGKSTASETAKEFFLVEFPYWTDQQVTCSARLAVYCELEPDGNGGGKVWLWTLPTALQALDIAAREALRAALTSTLENAPLIAADQVTLTRRS